MQHERVRAGAGHDPQVAVAHQRPLEEIRARDIPPDGVLFREKQCVLNVHLDLHAGAATGANKGKTETAEFSVSRRRREWPCRLEIISSFPTKRNRATARRLHS